ncbi:hypothetical protein SKAU_G00195200 [Synaphobranchus kaupii]|uniref:Uncharacterized protein n=1 Tax=Synaphobranchus kaupii TaxID=118154 RepID=A0A9Q1IX99_SYNKA|nr:hypothetical protein SKAU_G00195200 [Synaphobranchus kaupii]
MFPSSGEWVWVGFVGKETSEQKVKNGHLNPAFHLKVVGSSGKNSISNKKLPHTSKEVLPLRPAPAPTSTQPINIVRPLRPAPAPSPSPHSQRDLRVPRPPLPMGKPPTAPPKSPAHPHKLNPPKKPLPVSPARVPLLVSELQPRHSPSPPQRPLPLSPARGAPPKPSGGLLVMMPPAVGPKPMVKVSAISPLRALRPIQPNKPVPGVKPNAASSPFRK